MSLFGDEDLFDEGLFEGLLEISQDTIARSAAITREHKAEGATLDSTFIKLANLPKMDPSKCPEFPPSEIKVFNLDAFTAARNIMRETPDAVGRTSVLNLASDLYPAGGWVDTLTKTQEEALCYASTLYATLEGRKYYPWPNTGKGSDAGIYSPGIVIFKDDLDHACIDLPRIDRRVVSVITVAAPRHPRLTEDELGFKEPFVLEDLRKKILLVYRMAVHHEKYDLVLGAMGCGAYACPPLLVADEMKAILLTDEFHGWFRQVIFAVYSKDDGENLNSNFEIFRNSFAKIPINRLSTS